MQTRLTTRALGLAGVAVPVALAGYWFGSTDLVRIAVLLLVALAAGLLVVQITPRVVRRPDVTRTVRPAQLQAGDHAQVDVQVRGVGRRLVEIDERTPQHLMVLPLLRTREADRLHLSCTVRPMTRGEWDLGPVQVSWSDPLAVARRSTTIGPTTRLRVWPRIVPVEWPARIAGRSDRLVLGATTSSPDDVALRDYHEGDDLRRVHWPSSARRGQLVVRTDEQELARDLTIVVARPPDAQAFEWVLSLAASGAAAAFAAGRAVRLLGIGSEEHHRSDSSDLAALLDPTVDAVPASSAAEASAQVVRALGRLDGSHDHLLAVLGPVPPPRAWSYLPDHADVIVCDHAQPLLAAGFRVVVAPVGANVADVWTRLVQA